MQISNHETRRLVDHYGSSDALRDAFGRFVAEGSAEAYVFYRELDYFDMPQVRAVVRGAAKDNYKFSSIVLGIVNTEAFRKQGAPQKVKAVAAK